MLDEGTKTLDSLEIARRRERLGAILATGCDLDTCSASLNSLKSQLAPSLALLVRRRAQSGVPRRRRRAHPRPVARRHRAGKNRTDRPRAAHAAAAALRQGQSVRDSVHRQRHRSGDQIAHHRRHAQVRRRLSSGPTTSRSLSPATPRSPKSIPQLDAAFGDWSAPATKVPKRRPGQGAAAGEVDGLPAGSTGVAAVADHRRHRRAVDDGAEQSRDHRR